MFVVAHGINHKGKNNARRQKKVRRKSKVKSLCAVSRVKGMGLPCLGKGEGQIGGGEVRGQDTIEQSRGWMS